MYSTTKEYRIQPSHIWSGGQFYDVLTFFSILSCDVCSGTGCRFFALDQYFWIQSQIHIRKMCLLNENLVGSNRVVVNFSGWSPGQVDSSGIRTQNHGSIGRRIGHIWNTQKTKTYKKGDQDMVPMHTFSLV